MYHITSRGNAREEIYRDDVDCLAFLRTLATTVPRFRWICHSFCLIPNHYHLLLETPEPNLAKGMRMLNRSFAEHFNKRHGRVGHVFQGPYGDVLIETDEHLLEVLRYIALNPVRAGLAGRPADWPWSSYAALAGLSEAPTFLTTDLARSLLAGPLDFRDFVADGNKNRLPVV